MKSGKIITNLFAIALAAVLVGFDQFSKRLIMQNIPVNGDITLIEKVFKIVYVKNTGAAWGIFSNLTWLLTVFSGIILGAVVFLYLRLDWNVKRQRPLMILGVFIASGAIGNLIDRIVLKYVVDFLYFELIDFPVFNIADCYITISVIILAIMLIFYYKEEDIDLILKKKKRGSADG